jgi:hypothetical protein
MVNTARVVQRQSSPPDVQQAQFRVEVTPPACCNQRELLWQVAGEPPSSAHVPCSSLHTDTNRCAFGHPATYDAGYSAVIASILLYCHMLTLVSSLLPPLSPQPQPSPVPRVPVPEQRHVCGPRLGLCGDACGQPAARPGVQGGVVPGHRRRSAQVRQPHAEGELCVGHYSIGLAPPWAWPQCAGATH